MRFLGKIWTLLPFTLTGGAVPWFTGGFIQTLAFFAAPSSDRKATMVIKMPVEKNMKEV